MANISSYNQLSSWNEDDDLLFVQQPDAPKKAHPSQMKEYILRGLDVSSVGGTGKYISEISEADGKISATAETMDEAPTEGSTKAVTSGGIKTAIDNSVSLKSATGNPITLTDAANANAEELSMTIEPIQSGSGDPSPTNVRPISGISEAVATRCGFNIWDEEWELGLYNYTDGSKYENANRIRCKNPIPCEPNTSYYFRSSIVTGNNLRICFYDSLNNFISSVDHVQWNAAHSTPSNARYMTWCLLEVDTTTYSNDICINISDPNKNGLYEPYNGVTATITFGQTVYGGSVNFKTGEVTVTHGYVEYDGSNDEDWTSIATQAGNTYRMRIAPPSDLKLPAENTIPVNAISNQYMADTANNVYTQHMGFSVQYNGTYLAVYDANYNQSDSVSAWKTHLASEPLTVCYELATPTTLTLTPAELELLKGNNTITANGAEISIEYYPDNAIGALAGRVDDLDNTTSDMQEQITGLDTRVTALEEAGGGVSDFVQIGETASGVVSSGTLTAMMHKSNIANYSEFMFVAYCDDDSATVPAPIMLNKKLVQRVIDNSNSFSVTNGTITFTIKPQASFPVNHVVAELSGITTTDKRYNIEFYGRAI